MSAQDNLSPQQFYHGTSAYLKVGAMIEPGHPHNYSHLENSPHVFFTPDVEAAKDYAMAVSYPDLGHTYSVEPTGEHELDPEAIGSFVPRSLKGARMSKASLRVLGEV